MNLYPYIIIFFTILFAEIGDPTQVATLLFSTDEDKNSYLIFISASLALMTSTAVAVFIGKLASEYLKIFPLELIASIGFVSIGLFGIFKYLK